MIKLILLLHIGLALTSVGLAGYIGYQAKADIARITMANIKRMWLTLGGTIASGIGFAVLTHASFGHTCLALMSFILMILFAHMYQSNVRRSTGCPYLDQA